MSQKQPRRGEREAIKYGEVFNVSGELASKPVMPRDAAMMQSAENQLLGQIQKGGPAAMMESAAAKNERAGHVNHHAATKIARNQGVSVSETDDGVTETLGGQVLGQFMKDEDVVKGTMGGEALGSGVMNELGANYSASVQAPKVRAIEDYDFISNQQDTALNPRLSDNQDKNIDFNVSKDENPVIINSIPGGMGASMATVDQVKKNK